MRTLSTAAVLIFWGGLLPPAPTAGARPYVTVFLNGEVVFCDNGANTYVGIRVDSANGDLNRGAATNLNGAITGPLSVLNDQSPDFIEWGNLEGFKLGSPGSQDGVSAGAVLPAGVTLAELKDNYTFSARLQENPQEDIFFFETLFIICPEPGTLVLGLVGLSCFTVRRRQAARSFQDIDP